VSDAFHIAATGMHMQQKNVETVANNLANINTPGFKKARVNFVDMVYRGLASANPSISTVNGPSLMQGSGVAIASLDKSFSQGELKQTGNAMDVAIQGEGFIELNHVEDGSLVYSRGGVLTVDTNGMLSTADGYAIKPAIHVGKDVAAISISTDGRVMVSPKNSTESFEAGRIGLVSFADASGLLGLGNNLYRASDRSGDAIALNAGEDGAGTLVQGALENSNVSLVEEMVSLTVAQRAYESSVKVLQAVDEMLAMSNNLRK
jgi:flagellar basal-body rod protein FlgG